MKLAEFPNLKMALDLMGLDGGADPIPEAKVPNEWVLRCQLADEEARLLPPEELAQITQGAEEEMVVVAKKAPRLYEVLEAAFDAGPLAEIFFRPWQNIMEARAAEHRVHKGKPK